MCAILSHKPHSLAASWMQVEEGMGGHHEQLGKISDVDLLASFIWTEARGERLEVKLAVAHVVLNRVKARPYHGRTIQDVILKPEHFAGLAQNDTKPAHIPRLPFGDREFALCKAIAELATRGHLKNDPTGGATHFHRVNSKPSWASGLIFQRQIGNHIFYIEPLTRSMRDHGLPFHQPTNGRQL
jgi:N-acetylmuramoyl-L-alanine amidase